MSKILENTRHVVFLDTPHAGIDMEALRTLNGGHVSDHIERQYGLWSHQLEAQAKCFANIAESFNISSACASVLDKKGLASAQVWSIEHMYNHALKHRRLLRAIPLTCW